MTYPLNPFKRLAATGLYVCGVYDGLTAIIAEQKGFQALWLSGFSLSASLGLPDNSSMTAEDLCLAARNVRRASNLPLIVDCDAGYGSQDAAIVLAKHLKLIGVAGLCIEDYVHPKRNSFALRGPDSSPLMSQRAFCSTITRLKREVRVPFLIARTESLIIGETLNSAINRANEYVRAGADAALIHSRFASLNQFRTLADAWRNKAPLVAIPTNATHLKKHELMSAGFQIVIRANEVLRAIIQAAELTVGDLAADRPRGLSSSLVSMNHVFKITGLCH
jgi:phosphoenolpyruvate phosphomutase